MREKIELKEKIAAVDLKAKNLWDDMDDDQRKALKNEFWILNRYISNVKSNNYEHMAHYVITVNEYFNKNWADIQKHPKLAWLLLCMCSYDGKKTFYHEWIAGGKKKNSNKKQKLLEALYPNLKKDDIEILADISTSEDLKEIARQVGWSEKEIKDL
jgi:hypothetical protein